MHLKAGTLLQGDKYRIISTLGQGGFGITYLAEQVLAERKVCIKEFFPKEYYNRDEDSRSVSLGSMGSAEMMDAFKAKFIKEAKTIARLNHPNIIHIFDVFTENNTAYYVMEYIEGESLSQLLRRDGVLEEEKAVGYVRTVASALDYIHERNIMHLDIKPANIMLRAEDDSPVLIDFGLSKHYDENSGEATSTTPAGVSHGYAPMEQYQDGGVKDFSPSTDIYSLGATLYFLVTSKVPPIATTVGEEGIGKLPEHLSTSTCTAIERAMSYWRKDRPQSINEFLIVLKGELPDENSTRAIDLSEDTVFEPKKSIKAPKTKPTSKKSANKWMRISIIVDIFIAIAGLGTLFFFNTENKSVSSNAEEVIPPSDEIWYTSIEDKIVEPFRTDVFGAEVISNTYDNGKGIIKFDSDVKEIGDAAFCESSNLLSVHIPNGATRVGKGSFWGCTNLEHITIPEGVTEIGVRAFDGCNSIKNINIPKSVRVIGEYAFNSCTSLESITIPDGVTEICYGAFQCCSVLTDIALPSSITSIGEYSFAFCYELSDITIPKSVTEVGRGAFYACSNLKSITIPESVTMIGESVFGACNSIEMFNGKYAMDNGRCLIKDNSIIAFAPGSDITHYTIPDGVTRIGERTFEACNKLTNITIPNSVTAIEESAFEMCTSLKSITLPDSVVDIDIGVFADCFSLEKFEGKYAASNGCCLIKDDTIFAFAPAADVTHYTIPDNTTKIEDYTFWGCSNLESITIPNSVTEIGIGAFVGCSNLELFNSKYAIDSGRCLVKDNSLIAFAPAGLKQYTITDNVTVISALVFSHCSELKSVTIPQNVTRIEWMAFEGCNELRSVYCKATTPPLIDYDILYKSIRDTFQHLDCRIYVPRESVEKYKRDARWVEYADMIIGYGEW